MEYNPELKTLYWENASLEAQLGRYKDLEEKLGVSLFIFHELMEKLYCGGKDDIVFFKDEGEIRQGRIFEIDYCKKKLGLFTGEFPYADDSAMFVFGFNSYGENYAFTKEELE